MCFLQSLVRLAASALHTIHKAYKYLIPNLGQFFLHGIAFLIVFAALILLADRAMRRYARYRRAWSNVVLDNVKDDIRSLRGEDRERLRGWYLSGIEGVEVEVDECERGGERERDLEAQWGEEMRLDGRREGPEGRCKDGADLEEQWKDAGRKENGSEDRSEVEDKLQKEDAESDWEKTESVSSWSDV